MQKLKLIHKRRTLLVPTLLLLPTFGLAADNNMVDCAQLTDNVARLTCYDEVMQRQKSTPDLPVVRLPRAPRQDTVQDGAEGRPADVSDPADDFGLEVKQANQEGDSTRTMVVASARRTDLTGWTIEFLNGQVWRQVGTDDYTIREGERYTIQRGMFNSFLLGNTSDNRKIRVTRIE